VLPRPVIGVRLEMGRKGLITLRRQIRKSRHHPAAKAAKCCPGSSFWLFPLVDAIGDLLRVGDAEFWYWV
jgi:hypothetical protein